MPMQYNYNRNKNPYQALLSTLDRNQTAEDRAELQDARLLQDQNQFDANMTQRQKEQAAIAGRFALARKDVRDALLAKTAANDAYIKAMGETTDVINPMDAAKSVMASDKILTQIAQNEKNGSTMMPFMQRNPAGTVAPEAPVSTGKGFLADIAMNTPIDNQKMGEMLHDTSGVSDLTLFPDYQAPLPTYDGQPRDAIFKAPAKSPVPEPVTVMPTSIGQGTPITSSLEAEQNYVENMTKKILGNGTTDSNNIEAGLVTQQGATPESMIASLAKSYAETKDPRQKNAIAEQLVLLKNTQAATAAENKKYTHELNKIKFKEQMGGKYNPKTLNSSTQKVDHESMQKFIKNLPGLSDDGLLGGIANKVVGNGNGRMTERKVNEYVALARANKLSDAQIKAGLTTLSTNNWFFDNDVAMTPAQFVESLKNFVSGDTTTTKY